MVRGGDAWGASTSLVVEGLELMDPSYAAGGAVKATFGYGIEAIFGRLK